MMKKGLLFVFIFCVLIARADYWTQKTVFPGAGIDYPFSFTIGNKGYVGCPAITKDFWEYNPATNAWTQKADFGGTARGIATGFCIGNKGYAGTGNPASDDFWEYDATANIWTPKATFPGGVRLGAVGFAIGNFGYICSGTDWTIFYNDIWQYDPTIDTWNQKTNLPGVGRMDASCFVIGNNAYVLGGSTDGTASGVLPDLWEYGSSTDTWTQKANFPGTARCDAAAFSICDKGFYGTGDPCFCVDFWQYNPIANSWLQKADFGGSGRDETGSFSIGNKGYIGLGLLNDFWEYTPDSAICFLTADFEAANNICPGTCTNFTNLSTLATSYQWHFLGATPDTSTAINPTNICYANSGSYNVQLIATNANGSDTLLLSNYITVYPSPAAQAIAQSGDTLFANAGAASYQWYYNTTIINGATNYFYIAPQSGDYNVVCTDANGCEVEAAVFNVIAAVLPSPLGEGSGERLHPNPVVDKLEITGAFLKDKKEINISIYNIVGEKVFSAVDCQLRTVDCRLFPSGIYYLEVIAGKKTFRTKFVKL